jgi:hypothetical protein
MCMCVCDSCICMSWLALQTILALAHTSTVEVFMHADMYSCIYVCMHVCMYACLLTVTYALCLPFPAKSPRPPYSQPKSRRQSNAASAHRTCVSRAPTTSSSAPSLRNIGRWCGHLTTIFRIVIMAWRQSSGWFACVRMPSMSKCTAPASTIVSVLSGMRNAMDAMAVKPARIARGFFSWIWCLCVFVCVCVRV